MAPPRHARCIAFTEVRQGPSILERRPALAVRSGRVIGAVALLGAALLVGCAGQVPARDHGIAVNEQGDGWDVALSAPEASARSLDEWPGLTPEYSRLDAKLAVGDPGSYPLDQWPAAPTPRLERRGYLLIPADPGTVTYFRRR